MNIFILSTDPIEAAHAHCDQHIHKMILESAQMLSTAAHSTLPSIPKRLLYKPAYENHPCTRWVSSSYSAMVWVCTLAITLESIRDSRNLHRHASMDVISCISEALKAFGDIPPPTEFAEAMYPHVKVRLDLNTVEKYQLYYRKKHTQWLLDTGKGMSYSGRPVPSFMTDLIEKKVSA
jgi:hypothetical protein